MTEITRQYAGHIKMQGNTSTSESFREALKFAKKKKIAEGKFMVLFAMCCLNYTHYTGFRLNDKQFSAHPHEREVLFCEGTQVYVLDSEIIKIKNNNPNEQKFWEYYNDKEIIVIYLLHD